VKSAALFFVSAALLRAAEPAPVTFALKGGTWTIRNETCADYTISVDTTTYLSRRGSETPLKARRWRKWWWMPGLPGDEEDGPREVLHPLPGNDRVSYAPGEGVHTGPDHYGYDFSVPEGTPVRAMEAGVVIEAVNRYAAPHRDKSRLRQNNRVRVLHDDGTVATYAHLKKDSLLVEECDEVSAGDTLALSGNTGYSSGPHLHVEVTRAVSGRKYLTLPLLFRRQQP